MEMTFLCLNVFKGNTPHLIKLNGFRIGDKIKVVVLE